MHKSDVDTSKSNKRLVLNSDEEPLAGKTVSLNMFIGFLSTLALYVADVFGDYGMNTESELWHARDVGGNR